MLKGLDVDPMSTLLHEEAAAVDAYKHALTLQRGSEIGVHLREMFINHRESANLLRKHLRVASPRSDICVESWNAVQAAHDEFSQLEALKRAEECSRDLYRKILTDSAFPPGGRTLIAAMLLPQTERHVATLGRLLVDKI